MSGFAGLSYELLWVRLLSFSFGSTTLSFSTVLAVFFGGLALGAFLAGKRSARIRNPVRVYALIEIVTGVFGLLIYPVLSNLDEVFASIDPGVGLAGAAVRAAVATPLLLVPTLLMGATLPVVCVGMIEDDDEIGRGTALIYGFNTLGAFCGAYFMTYHLLPSLGVFRATLLTVAINFLVGGIALAFARGGRDTREPADITAGEQSVSSVPKKLLQVATFLTFLGGLAAICFQIVWVRLFSVLLDGTIYGVGSVLISVLIGIALGSMFISKTLQNTRHPGVWFAAFQIVTIASVLLMAFGLQWVAFQLDALGWQRDPTLRTVHVQLLIVFIVLLPPTFSSGASFPLLIQMIENRASQTGRAVGSLYAANTIGSILGSLLTGFVLLPAAGSEATMLIAITLTAMIGAIGAATLADSVPGSVRAALALVALGGVAVYDGLPIREVTLGFQPNVSYQRQQAPIKKRLESLAYFTEGEVATVSVFATDEARNLTLNGLGQGSRHTRPPHYLFESLLVGIVPVAHIDRPERAMVVGLGAGVTVDVLVKLGVPQIHVLELEPRVADAVSIIFGEDNPLDNPAVKLEINDARHRLLLGARRGGDKYDLITSMPAHPWVASSIFTQEFFELAATNLSERGIFCTWFGVGRMDDLAVQALLRAFTAVFDDYVVYRVPEAGAYFLVGSNQPLTIDPARLERLHARSIVRQREELSSIYFLPMRVYATGTADTPKPPAGIVNTDDSAFVEVHAPRSSTRSATFLDFMAAEYVQPALVPQPARHKFYSELIESLLGTPGGKLPLVQTTPSWRRAERTLDGTKDLFNPQEQAYFRGRIDLARRQMPQARRRLDEAAGGGGEVGLRAAKFVTETYPAGSEAHRSALDKLAPTPDVLVAQLDVDFASALARVPTEAPDPKLEPIGWLLWRHVHEANTSTGTSADDRAIVSRHVGPALAKTHRLGLLQVCQQYAAKHDFDAVEQSCKRWLATGQAARARKLFDDGRRAGARADFKRAAALLSQANALRPGHEKTVELLLRSRIEISDARGVAALMDEMRFFGYSDELIDHLVEQARAGRLSKGDLQAVPEPKSEDDAER